MNRMLGLLYVAFSKSSEVRKGIVLLESHHCAGFFGSPYYIAKHLLQNEQFSQLRVIIVCPKRDTKKVLRQLGSSRVTCCTNRSIRYVYYLAIAQFLVNDVTFPVYFSRRNEQKYLNTWHGTPLKSLGRKSPQDLFLFVSNTQRNFLHATHLLAPNRHTERVLLEDYMIAPIWRGTVLTVGYPRNDVLTGNVANFSHNNEDASHFAFMPTWRGTLSTVDEASQTQLRELRELLDFLDMGIPKGSTLWVRLHPLVKDSVRFEAYKKLRPFPQDIEPYEHLARCSALITDYSSVMFDFAATGRPIILYTPDLEDYRSARNFCLDIESLPFTRVESQETLLEKLIELSLSTESPSDAYKVFQREYCAHDSGDSTRATCSAFFLGNELVKHQNTAPDPGKKNVLIFGGSFLNNGITTSLKTLLSLIDLERMNIILWVNADSAAKNSGTYFHNLDERISYIPTKNWLAVDPLDALRVLWKDVFTRHWDTTDPLLKSVWTREWQRNFGGAHFDSVVHFTGYERSVSLLFNGCDAHKVMCMHSDMAKEIEAGKPLDARALKFGCELANVVATVRPGAESSYCSKYLDVSHKVRYLPNTININCKGSALAPLEAAFSEGIHCPKYQHIAESLISKKRFRFINLARFSPEKGQVRLISAFQKIWTRHPETELYILGGYGTSYDEVLNAAKRSPARDSVFVVVGSSNPFPLVKQMDALVFASFYEGIGLVLFEAFALGLPVISTDIAGPSELLRQGYGLVVENSEDGLVEGMLSALRGEIPMRAYDFDAHNAFALRQFYAAVDPLQPPTSNSGPN